MFGQFFENKKLEKRQSGNLNIDRMIFKTQPEIESSIPVPKKNFSIAKLNNRPVSVLETRSLKLSHMLHVSESKNKIYKIPEESRFNNQNSSGRSKSSKNEPKASNKKVLGKFESIGFSLQA